MYELRKLHRDDFVATYYINDTHNTIFNDAIDNIVHTHFQNVCGVTGFFKQCPELFYVVPNQGAIDQRFDAYAGQPIVLWNKTTAKELYTLLGGYAGILSFFDPYPVDVNMLVGCDGSKSELNGKIILPFKGICSLQHAINIVYTSIPIDVFLNHLVSYSSKVIHVDGSTGDYSVLNYYNAAYMDQFCSRFPFVYAVADSKMLFMVNAVKHYDLFPMLVNNPCSSDLKHYKVFADYNDPTDVKDFFMTDLKCL